MSLYSTASVKRSRSRTAFFMVALAGGMLLLVLGLLIRPQQPPPATGVELTMVCISGFSWDDSIPLHRSGQLPCLSSLFQQQGSYGDIINAGFKTDTAILASLVTGCFPEKHGINETGELMRSGTVSAVQMPLWQVLAARGQRSIVIGFPLSYPQEPAENIVVSAAALMAGSAAGPGLPGHGLNAIQKAEQNRRAALPATTVTRGEALSNVLLEQLASSMAADVRSLQAAVSALSLHSDYHLFVYFSGLGQWQQQLTSSTLPKTTQEALIKNYYIFIDQLLQILLSARSRQGIFIIVSESGSRRGLPAHQSYLPGEAQYPAAGFFYAAGVHILPGIAPLSLHPADLAPTLLYLTGNPVANTMDGGVMFKLLDEDYYFHNKLEFK